MQGLYMRLTPFTPDNAGAATVFGDLPATVVPFDMNGTVSTFRNRVGVEPESQFQMISALGTREVNYVLGDASDFADEALKLMDIYGGEFLVLMNGPVSAMLGMDLQSLAAQAAQRLGRRVIAIETTTSALHDEGLSKAMMAVYAQVKAEQTTSDAASTAAFRHGVNILGLNAIDHDLPLRKSLLKAIATATGQQPLSVWGCLGGWDEWKLAPQAQESIVVTASALKLAQTMERDWGIPYRRIDELDLSLASSIEPLPGAQNLKVLVVHEQLMANMARKVLQAFGCQVIVASFQKLQRKAKQDGDIQLKGEQHLVELLASGEYDVLVGDHALLACVPQEDGPAFIELMHSAVAPILGAHEPQEETFSPQWQQMARRVLADAITAAALLQREG